MLMKETLQSIAARHGVDNVHYSVISFGAQTRRIVDFQDTFPDEDALITQLEKLSSVAGAPDFDLAMADARNAFQGPGARPNAKKILIVIVDNKPSSTEKDILKFARILEVDDVNVIPVAVGSEVTRDELEKATAYKKNILEVPAKETPESLGKKIMSKVRESKSDLALFEKSSVLVCWPFPGLGNLLIIVNSAKFLKQHCKLSPNNPRYCIDLYS